MDLNKMLQPLIFLIILIAIVHPAPVPPPTPHPSRSAPQGIIPPWGGVLFQPRTNPSGTVPPHGRYDYTPAGPVPPGLQPLRPPPPPSSGTFEFVAGPPPPEDEISSASGLGTCFRPFVAAQNPNKLTFLDLMNAVDGGPKDEGALAVEYTLKQGVDPNQMPYDLRSGESILLHAVFCNKEEIVKILLQYGANPNQAKASDGITPLHYAAWRDSVKMMRALVDKGANVAAVDRQGHSVFERALCMHALKAADYISTLVGSQRCTNNPSQQVYWQSDFPGRDMCYRIHRYYEHDMHG